MEKRGSVTPYTVQVDANPPVVMLVSVAPNATQSLIQTLLAAQVLRKYGIPVNSQTFKAATLS